MADLPPDDQKEPEEKQASTAGSLADLASDQPAGKPSMAAPTLPSTPSVPKTKPSFPPMQDGGSPAEPEEKKVEEKAEAIGITPPAKKSKRNKVILAVLAILFILGSVPAAVYLVQQRQEIRKEAATAEIMDATDYVNWCFWCGGRLDQRETEYCGWKSDSLYAVTRKPRPGKGDNDNDGGPEAQPQACNYEGEASSIWNSVGAKCSSLQFDQSVIGGGGTAHPPRDGHNLQNCDDCTNLTVEITAAGLRAVATGYSDYPKFEYEGQCEDNFEANCAEWNEEKGRYDFGKTQINYDASNLKFKFRLSTGEESPEVTGSCDGDHRFNVWEHDPADNRITCTAEYTFPGITSLEGLTVSAVVRNPVASADSFPAQASPACQKSSAPSGLSCQNLTRDPTGTLYPGDEIALTCTGGGESLDHYNFQYTSTLHSGWFQASGYDNNQTGTVPYYIPTETEGATYTFQCQVCDENETGCSDWADCELQFTLGSACQGQCLEIKAYDSENNDITDDLKAGVYLPAVGEVITFAVQGTTDCASDFTKGRFRINNGAWQETTNQNASGEFYLNYTVPSTGTYTIEAMVFSTDLGWK